MHFPPKTTRLHERLYSFITLVFGIEQSLFSDTTAPTEYHQQACGLVAALETLPDSVLVLYPFIFFSLVTTVHLLRHLSYFGNP